MTSLPMSNTFKVIYLELMTLQSRHPQEMRSGKGKICLLNWFCDFAAALYTLLNTDLYFTLLYMI